MKDQPVPHAHVLPCPFCGRRGELYRTRFGDGQWAVICARCDVRGTRQSSEDGAIRFWNVRPTDSLLPCGESTEAAHEVYNLPDEHLHADGRLEVEE